MKKYQQRLQPLPDLIDRMWADPETQHDSAFQEILAGLGEYLAEVIDAESDCHAESQEVTVKPFLSASEVMGRTAHALTDSPPGAITTLVPECPTARAWVIGEIQGLLDRAVRSPAYYEYTGFRFPAEGLEEEETEAPWVPGGRVPPPPIILAWVYGQGDLAHDPDGFFPAYIDNVPPGDGPAIVGGVSSGIRIPIEVALATTTTGYYDQRGLAFRFKGRVQSDFSMYPELPTLYWTDNGGMDWSFRRLRGLTSS